MLQFIFSFFDNHSDLLFTNYHAIHSHPKLKYIRNAVLSIEVSIYLNPHTVFRAFSVHITPENVCIMLYEKVLFLILLSY